MLIKPVKKGLLLINLGTPDSPKIKSVRQYLREFLLDKRVIQLPWLIRYLVVYGLILPFRTKKASQAYRSIWTSQGSPLRVYSEQLTQKVKAHLADDFQVQLAMRYGTPSIAQALEQLKGCDEITILPLYPQYASSSTGSAIECALSICMQWPIIPSLRIIRDFYQQAGFIQAMAEKIKPYLQQQFILFSYHGIPENHLINQPCQSICSMPCEVDDSSCYRAQCYQTSRLVAEALNLPKKRYQTAFQSRLGRTEWIKPYTDAVLPELINAGIKHLAIVCPSFVADCLETIEEIGMRAKAQWLSLGGASFILIPCINDDDLFVQAIIDWVK